jgi:outer membrane autotransporter protein
MCENKFLKISLFTLCLASSAISDADDVPIPPPPPPPPEGYVARIQSANAVSNPSHTTAAGASNHRVNRAVTRPHHESASNFGGVLGELSIGAFNLRSVNHEQLAQEREQRALAEANNSRTFLDDIRAGVRGERVSRAEFEENLRRGRERAQERERIQREAQERRAAERRARIELAEAARARDGNVIEIETSSVSREAIRQTRQNLTNMFGARFGSENTSPIRIARNRAPSRYRWVEVPVIGPDGLPLLDEYRRPVYQTNPDGSTRRVRELIDRTPATQTTPITAVPTTTQVILTNLTTSIASDTSLSTTPILVTSATTAAAAVTTPTPTPVVSVAPEVRAIVPTDDSYELAGEFFEGVEAYAPAPVAVVPAAPAPLFDRVGRELVQANRAAALNQEDNMNGFFNNVEAQLDPIPVPAVISAGGLLVTTTPEIAVPVTAPTPLITLEAPAGVEPTSEGEANPSSLTLTPIARAMPAPVPAVGSAGSSLVTTTPEIAVPVTAPTPLITPTAPVGEVLAPEVSATPTLRVIVPADDSYELVGEFFEGVETYAYVPSPVASPVASAVAAQVDKESQLRNVAKDASAVMSYSNIAALQEATNTVLDARVAEYTNYPVASNTDNQASGASAGEGFTNPINVWVRGFAGYSKQKSSANVTGFKTKHSGGMIGVDTLINDTNLIGLAFTHARLDTKLTSGTSRSAKREAGLVNAYWTHYATDTFFINSQVGYGKIRIKTTDKSGLKAKGQTISIKEELGYNINFENNVKVTPTVGMSYNEVKFSDSSLTDNSGKYKLSGSKHKRLAANAGVDVSKAINLDNLTLVPSVNAGIEQVLNSKSSLVKVTSLDYAADPMVSKEKTAKTTYKVGTGLKLLESKGELSVNYDMNIRKGFKSHTGSVKLKINF